MKVIKRNDSEQDFCLDKIVNAVKKANNSVPKEDQMNEEAIQKVINTVQRSLEGFNSVKVEDIQDLVEKALVRHNKYVVSKAYIIYRQKKKEQKKFTENEEKVLSLVSGNSDLRGDNANKNIDDNMYVAIIDYKTYDIDAKMDLLKHGLKIQLPIYLYLVKKNMPNAIIVGFYIQKVLSLENIYDEKESLIERKKKNLKLSGYSNSDGHIIGLLDYNYKDSNVIKGLKVKNDGSFYHYSKVLSNEQMDEIYNDVENVIKKVINNIENGKFDINPKIYAEKNISCTYCKFKDLCYKTSKDEVTIEKEDSNE